MQLADWKCTSSPLVEGIQIQEPPPRKESSSPNPAASFIIKIVRCNSGSPSLDANGRPKKTTFFRAKLAHGEVTDLKNPLQFALSSSTYCTTHYTLNVSRIWAFIENEESFRKFCHGGCEWNSILVTTTDFWFFGKLFFSKILYVFRWTSVVNITSALSKSAKILENPESWDRKFPWSTINIVTWARRSMPVSRRTRADHDKHFFKIPKFNDGVFFNRNVILSWQIWLLVQSLYKLDVFQISITSSKKSFGTQFKAHIVACRAARHLRLKTLLKDQN